MPLLLNLSSLDLKVQEDHSNYYVTVRTLVRRKADEIVIGSDLTIGMDRCRNHLGGILGIKREPD